MEHNLDAQPQPQAGSLVARAKAALNGLAVKKDEVSEVQQAPYNAQEAELEFRAAFARRMAEEHNPNAQPQPQAGSLVARAKAALNGFACTVLEHCRDAGIQDEDNAEVTSEPSEELDVDDPK